MNLEARNPENPVRHAIGAWRHAGGIAKEILRKIVLKKQKTQATKNPPQRGSSHSAG